MIGTRRPAIVLQPRDYRLLSALRQVRVVDRDMAKVLAGFRSKTRVNTRLSALSRAGLLRRFFVGTVAAGRKAVYTLSEKGILLVGSERRVFWRKQDENLVADLFVAHELGIAGIFVAIQILPDSSVKTRDWRTFDQRVASSGLIPDGYFALEMASVVRPCFLEVDCGTESLKVWQKKISGYIHLAASGDFLRIFGQSQFRVLVVLTSEKRLHHLRVLAAKSTDKIFWFTTFEFIRREGFWSSIWFRPLGDKQQSLL